MATLQIPLINGYRPDVSSVSVKINGVEYIGVKEITYKNAMDFGEVRGTSPQKLARTRGQYKPESSITLFKDESDAFLRTIGTGYLEKGDNRIVVTFFDSNGAVSGDILIEGARIKDEEEQVSSGNEPVAVKYTLDVMYITKNGISPIQNLRR